MDSGVTSSPADELNGYTLIEVAFNLVLVSMLLTAVIRCALVTWTGAEGGWREAEFRSDWSHIERMLLQDGHGARAATVSGDMLSLQMVDGHTIRYLLNASGEVIRLLDTGGTSVVGVDVSRVQFHWQNGCLATEVTLVNGDTYAMVCAGVSAWSN